MLARAISRSRVETRFKAGTGQTISAAIRKLNCSAPNAWVRKPIVQKGNRGSNRIQIGAAQDDFIREGLRTDSRQVL